MFPWYKVSYKLLRLFPNIKFIVVKKLIFKLKKLIQWKFIIAIKPSKTSGKACFYIKYVADVNVASIETNLINYLFKADIVAFFIVYTMR